jgi:small subunit ribosomal protein S6
MLRYEVLLLTVPEITKDESQSIQDLFSKTIRKAKGTMLAFDRWGKYRLAYQVRKNEYGVYFLVRFDVEQSERDALLADLTDIFVFKCNTLIMKNIIQRLEDNADLAYNRPESLEDNPQDLNDFLKKNEMNGFLKKNPARQTEESKEASVEAFAIEEASEIEEL